MQEQISRASGKVDGHSDGDFSRHQKNSLTTFGLDSDPRSSSSSPTLHSSVYLKDSTQSSSRAVAPSSENDTPSQISDSTEKEQDNQNTSSSEGIRRKLRIPVPHYPMDSSATTCNLLAKRVRYMRAYLKLRHSPLPDASESGNASPSKVAEWLTVCAAEVVHVTPLLAYRQEKDIQQMSCCPRDCMYECRGVDAVAMDCQRIAEYFDSLRGTSSSGEATSPHDRNNFNRSGSKSAKSRPQRQWLASFEMNSDSATLCDNGSTLLLCYKLTVQAVDQPAPSVVNLERKLPEVFSLASSKMPNTQPILPLAATASATLPATVGNSTTPSFDRQLKSANSTSSSSRSPVMPQGQGIDQLRQMDCGAEDDPESDSQEDNDDDDICKWLEMALDTTYIHDPRYEKRRAGSIGRDFSEQESSRLSHTGTAASTSAPPLEECESDSEGAVCSPTEDRSAKRSKSSSSNNDIDVSGAAETEALPPVCGTVLFQLCIQARVEFGCCGCDSDGRILRVTEHY